MRLGLHTLCFVFCPLCYSLLHSFLFLSLMKKDSPLALVNTHICFADCLGLFGVTDRAICTKYFEMHLEDCLGIITGPV